VNEINNQCPALSGAKNNNLSLTLFFDLQEGKKGYSTKNCYTVLLCITKLIMKLFSADSKFHAINNYCYFS
jgi:hypothetical protein